MSEVGESRGEADSRKRRRSRKEISGDEIVNDDDDANSESERRHHTHRRNHRKKRHHNEDNGSNEEESRRHRHKSKKRRHHRKRKRRDSSGDDNIRTDRIDNTDGVKSLESPELASGISVGEKEVSCGEKPREEANQEQQQQVEQVEKDPVNVDESGVSPEVPEQPPSPSQDTLAGPVRKMAGFLPAKLSLPKAVTTPTLSPEADDLWDDTVTGVVGRESDAVASRAAGTSSLPTDAARAASPCVAASPPARSTSRARSHHHHRHDDQQQQRQQRRQKSKSTGGDGDSGSGGGSGRGDRSPHHSCSCSRSASPAALKSSRGDRRHASRSPHHRGRRRKHSDSCSCSDGSPADAGRHRSGPSRRSPVARRTAASKSHSHRRSPSPAHRSRAARYRARSPAPQRRSRSPRRYRSRSRSPRRRYRSRSPRSKRAWSPRRRSRSPPPRRRRSRSPMRRASPSPRRYGSRYQSRSRSRSPRRRRGSPPPSPGRLPSAADSRAQSPNAGTATTSVTVTMAPLPPLSSSSSFPVGSAAAPVRTGLARFTTLCSKISGKRSDDEGRPGDEDDETRRAVRHPFALPKASTLAQARAAPFARGPNGGPLALTYESPAAAAAVASPSPFAAGAINIGDIVAQVRARNPAVLKQSFPVSTGVKHQKAEDVPGQAAVQVDPGAPSGKAAAPPPPVPQLDTRVIAKHAELLQQVELNPQNFTAMSQLATLRTEISQFCAKATQLRQQHVQQDRLRPLSKAELEAGTPAWAKKDMFSNLNPVPMGFGAKMLRKHGWSRGQSLGKNGDGHTEPVPIMFKSDRKGLASFGEGPGRKSSKMSVLPTKMNGRPGAAGGASTGGMTIASLASQGKHPVSVLMEHCSRMRMAAPNYLLTEETGPQHSKSFRFKVTIQGVTYTSAAPLNNKKQAKAAAAMAAVLALGLH